MRTLQEKYNGIQEGKFSKDQFLRDTRMEFPNLVTQYNGYDDAVQILKNRGMIQEAVKENAVKAHMEKLIQAAKTGNKTKESILAGFAGADIKYKVTNAEPNVIKYWNDEQGLEGEIKLKEPVKEARLTNKSLTDYRYKPTNDMDKYPYEQILRGLRVELEELGVQGTPTADEYKKALGKVLKNLEKDEIFYTNQVAGVTKKVDLHDKMVDATAKNTVDTFNGMKKAELKEGFKKLIKKVLSETIVDVEDYNGDDEFDMYGDDEADDIPHPRGYEDQDEIDYDDKNFSDPFIDGDLDESKMSDVHILAQEAGTLRDFLLSVKAQHPGVDLRRDIEELQHIWNNREQDEVDYDDIDISGPEIDTEFDIEPNDVGDPGYVGYESPSDKMYNSDAWVEAQRDMMETRKAKSLSELLK